MEINNSNDAKIIAYLRENGPSRLWELMANAGVPRSTAFQRCLRLEARQIVKVTREPTRGRSALKTVFSLANENDEKEERRNEQDKGGVNDPVQ